MGIYKKYVYAEISEEKIKIFSEELAKQNLKGIMGSSISYDPKTQELTYFIAIDEEELPKLSSESAEIASIGTAIDAVAISQFGKATIPQDITDGSLGLTARDRGRQFMQAVRDDIDPETIGVYGETLAIRKATLRRYAENSKRAFGL